jgi:hypothetical protein
VNKTSVMSTNRLLKLMMVWLRVRSANKAQMPLMITLPKNKQAHTKCKIFRLTPI